MLLEVEVGAGVVLDVVVAAAIELVLVDRKVVVFMKVVCGLLSVFVGMALSVASIISATLESLLVCTI